MKNRHFQNADKNSRRGGRRRGTARLFVLGAAFAATAAGSTLSPVYAQSLARASPAQTVRMVQFSIPAGPLDQVLTAFERVAGIRATLALDSLASIQSPGVSGTYTVEGALQQILMGTSVTFRLTSPTEAVLELRQSESVEVSGSTPVVQSPKYTGAAARHRADSGAGAARRSSKSRARSRSATCCATCRASRCRPAKAAARRTPPATCSTCAASTPRTASSSTACATTA